MFNIGDYVVYKREVCKITDIKKNFIGGKDYYVMHNVNDKSLTINIPMENRLGLLRSIISKQQAENLIDSIFEISVSTSNDRMIENEYKVLMNSNKLEDLIKLIKMIYLRNEERVSNGRKMNETDDIYFKKAENILYSEIALALEMSYDEVKNYIIEKVGNIEKNK